MRKVRFPSLQYLLGKSALEVFFQQKYGPGTYKIIAKTGRRATARTEGSFLGPLKKGELVEVDRVEKVEERWRARILDETEVSWFTIEKISTGKVYAEISVAFLKRNQFMLFLVA